MSSFFLIEAQPWNRGPGDPRPRLPAPAEVPTTPPSGKLRRRRAKGGLVFVDTSVWVEALRGSNSDTVERLGRLLDDRSVGLPAPVRIELLSGASTRDFRRLAEDLSALPTFEPTARTWETLEGWVATSVAAGERFGVGDLLIGAIAAEHDGQLWTFDRDFERLQRLGLVDLYDPERPGS